MTEHQIEIALKPPVQPATGTWARIRRFFLDPQQDQAVYADNLLSGKIMQSLEADNLLGRREVANMNIAVSGGVATLTGHVGRATNKERIEALASKVPGVNGVVNQLVGDYELMIEVAQALGNDLQTKSEHIQVNVQHGIVYLSGSVSQEAVRVLAAQTAAQLPWGRGIINRIEVLGLVPEFKLDAEEERFVQPRIGKSVYATDGQVGHVHGVVVSPQNRRVVAAVVHAQLDIGQEAKQPSMPTERRVLIPITNIERTESGVVHLNIKSDAVLHFDDYAQNDFVAPPADWLPPYPYALADVQFCQDFRHDSLDENSG